MERQDPNLILKKMDISLEKQITLVAKSFLDETKDKEVQVISHFDTDGISSAAIITQALKSAWCTGFFDFLSC